MSDAGGFIYAIGAEGLTLVKIGRALDVGKRLKELQTGQPFPLHLVAAVSVEMDAQRVERQVHTLLSHVHRRGEWFEIVLDASTLEALVLQAIQHVLTVQEEQAATRRPRRGSVSSSVLGTHIREARLSAGLTQYALAKSIGISKQALYAIEANKTPDPGALKVKAIAQTLHVSADYLLGLREDSSETPTPLPPPVTHRARTPAPVA
jgi:DNA-binding XRE family transcriptional regulator